MFKENDLISRSALKNDLLDRSFFPVIVKNAIENAPAVDAVEVVRCKDCKYCFFDLSGRAYHLCMRHGVTARYRVQSEDFCSYAERRTDDGK